AASGGQRRTTRRARARSLAGAPLIPPPYRGSLPSYHLRECPQYTCPARLYVARLARVAAGALAVHVVCSRADHRAEQLHTSAPPPRLNTLRGSHQFLQALDGLLARSRPAPRAPAAAQSLPA